MENEVRKSQAIDGGFMAANVDWRVIATLGL